MVSRGQLSRLCPPANFLPTPSLLAGQEQNEKQRKPRSCANAAEQQPEHGCVINTALGTNAKHGTIRTATKEVNPIPTRPNTLELEVQKWTQWCRGGLTSDEQGETIASLMIW